MDNNENTFDFDIIQISSPKKEADVETSYYCVSFSYQSRLLEHSKECFKVCFSPPKCKP